MIYRMLVCEPNRNFFATKYDWSDEIFIDEAEYGVKTLSDMLDNWKYADDYSFYEAYIPNKDTMSFTIVRNDMKMWFIDNTIG